MADMMRVAVAQWNSRGKENLVVIAPYKGGLILYQMFYATEVRPFDEVKVTGKATISDPERTMARTLLMQLSTDKFDPSKYEDHYVARVKKAIDEKVNGGSFKTAAIDAPRTSSVVDLATLLAKSLEAGAKGKPAPTTKA
jgi:DNA end-binding protein Ku